jgi:hypothetical protein
MNFFKSPLNINYIPGELIMGMIHPRNVSHIAGSKPTVYGQMKLSEDI